MPKVGKSKRAAKVRAVIAGLPALFAGREALELLRARHTIASLTAKLGALLEAMAKVHKLTIARRVAIQQERAIEASLRPLLASMKSLAVAQAGAHDAGMRKLGFEPDRKPRMTVETKVVANVKRQATRKARGYGKKKRSPR